MRLNILTRYIAWQVIKSILFVMVIILGLYLFVSLISELGDIGQGHYGIIKALQYILMNAPLNVYHLFPMICLLGSLVGLGMLASHNEITIMRAATMSLSRIIGVVLGAALLLIIAAVAIGEGVGPAWANHAAYQKALAENSDQALQTNEGMWLRSGEHFIHVGNVIPGVALQNVTDFHFNQDNQLDAASFAKKAVQRGHHWYLQYVQTTYFHNSNKLSHSQDQQCSWQVTLNPELLGFFAVSAQQVSLYKLYHLIQYQRDNGLSAKQYEFVFWQRLFQPLAILLMIMLAIPFVFGPLRNVSMGLRIVTGVVIGFAFFLLNRFLGPVSLVFQLSPLFSALLPIVLFSIVACFMLYRVR